VAGLIIGLLTFVMGKYWPVGADYFYTFRPAAEAWLTSQADIYAPGQFGYFGAPWGIFLILPTLLLPIQFGQALLSVFSLIGLLLAVYLFNSGQDTERVKPLIVALAIANLHTFDMLIRGNIDAVPVVGLTLSLLGLRHQKALLLGIGLLLLSIKPVNVLLPIAVILWHIRHWPRRALLVSLAPLAVTFLISLPLFGPDWPLRYLAFLQASPPMTYLQTSLWRGMEFLGFRREAAAMLALPVLIAFFVTLSRVKKAAAAWKLSLATATNLFITPYALGSHYTLLAPIFTKLSSMNKRLMWIWLLTLTPLLRLVGGGKAFERSWIDVTYPLSVMIACFWIMWKKGAGVQGDITENNIDVSELYA
jgi:hypothetical protein